MQITIVNNAVNIEKFQGLIKDSKKIVNMKNVLKNCMDIRPGLAVKNPTQKNPPKVVFCGFLILCFVFQINDFY